MLSTRALSNAKPFMALLNSARPVSRPNPCIDLSVAENQLMRLEIQKVCERALTTPFSHEMFLYERNILGCPKLRSALAALFNAFFHPHVSVKPSHITTGSGAASLLDGLMFAICNAGDAILVAAPYWSGFDFCLKLRSSVRIIPICTPRLQDCFELSFVDQMHRVFNGDSQKHKIKAVVICNPNNPLGRCYSTTFLAKVLEFCEEKSIHLISDELYALSAFCAPNKTAGHEPFCSVLSLDAGALGCNPKRVHAVWSMSKDFGCNGLRLGCVISQANTDLVGVLALATANQVSSLSAMVATSILSQPQRQLRRFIDIHKSRLRRCYAITAAFLDSQHIEYIPANAGGYIWAHIGKDRVENAQEEIALLRTFESSGVLLSAGSSYHSSQPGWFRIFFAIPEDALLLALSEMGKVLAISHPKHELDASNLCIVRFDLQAQRSLRPASPSSLARTTVGSTVTCWSHDSARQAIGLSYLRKEKWMFTLGITISTIFTLVVVIAIFQGDRRYLHFLQITTWKAICMIMAMPTRLFEILNLGFGLKVIL